MFVSLTGQQLNQLRHQLHKSKRPAYATGTFKHLITQCRSFISFCFYFDLPWSIETQCLYVQLLSKTFTPTSSIKKITLVELSIYTF